MSRTLDTIIGLLTLVAVVIGVRGVLGARRWVARRRGRPRVFTTVLTVSPLLTLAVALLYPRIAEQLVAGREVTWEAAAYGWPALTAFVWTVIAASLATLAARLAQLALLSRPGERMLVGAAGHGERPMECDDPHGG